MVLLPNPRPARDLERKSNKMYIALLCAFYYQHQLNKHATNGVAYLVGNDAVILFDTEEEAIKFAENYGVKWECWDEHVQEYMWYSKYVIVLAKKG